MKILETLFTSAEGLLSLGVVVFIIVMGIYMNARLRRLMNEKPGKEGWS